ncbi:hypothetical protein [Nitrobacter sp. TKz-YC02]|uniref:hypothetical protein n=1 Tax=Nitrobacter sp. TKz-YC02 TaxID=3398704 RepID=UPI003CF8BD66
MIAVLTALVVVLPVVHIAIAGEVPLLKALRAHSIVAAIPEREHFNKGIPQILSYSFQYVLTVFGPLLAGLLLYARRYLATGAVILWCTTYALSSAAKWPGFIFLLTATVLFIALRRPRLRAAVPIAAAVCGSILLLGTHYMYRTLIPWQAAGGAAQEIAVLEHSGARVGLGDLYRLSEATDGPTRFGHVGDYLIYRTYFAPVEVSSRWYDYFPEAYGRYLGLDGIVRSTLSGRSPSNIIGVEVYKKLFPYRYYDSTSAYASVDADANAHWGLPGVIVLGFLMIFMRAVSVIATDTALGKIAQTANVMIFTMVPYQGSLQAMLIAHGALLLIAVQVCCWWRTTASCPSRESA